MIGRLRFGMVASVYWLHATLALGFAWPVARLIGVPALAHPRGDAVLFDESAIYLTEVLRLYRPALASLAEGMSFFVLLLVYFGLFPLAMMLHALATREVPSFSTLLVAASRSFAPMSLLLGLALTATALALGLPLCCASLLETKLHAAFGERGADIAKLGIMLGALSMAALIAVIHDLARAAVAIRAVNGVGAVALALASFRVKARRAVAAFVLRWIAALSLVFAGALAAARLGVETDVRFATVVVLHQAVVFTLILLRAVWLRFAMTLLIDEA